MVLHDLDALARDYVRGVVSADIVVESSVGFVYSLIDKYRSSGLMLSLNGSVRFLRGSGSRDELFQAGLIGLWKCLSKYSPDKGSFSAYAGSYVAGFVHREADSNRLVHVPEYLRSRIRGGTYDERLRVLSETELYAEPLGLEGAIRVFYFLANRPVDIFRREFNCEFNPDEFDYVFDGQYFDSFDHYSDLVRFCLGKLDGEKLWIVKARFGIDRVKLTLEEIAEEIGNLKGRKYTGESIRQKEQNAINLLRTKLKNVVVF